MSEKRYWLTVVLILLAVYMLEGCSLKRSISAMSVDEATKDVITETDIGSDKAILTNIVDIPYIGSDTTISTSCKIDIYDSWTAFMTNPYLWSYNDNSSFKLGVASEKFESFDKFQNDFLEVAGSFWKIKNPPKMYSIKNTQFDYVLYAEYGDDRIVDFLMLDDNGLVWYIEFDYVENADNAVEIIDQAKQMIYSFRFAN